MGVGTHPLTHDMCPEEGATEPGTSAMCGKVGKSTYTSESIIQPDRKADLVCLLSTSRMRKEHCHHQATQPVSGSLSRSSYQMELQIAVTTGSLPSTFLCVGHIDIARCSAFLIHCICARGLQDTRNCGGRIISSLLVMSTLLLILRPDSMPKCRLTVLYSSQQGIAQTGPGDGMDWSPSVMQHAWIFI